MILLDEPRYVKIPSSPVPVILLWDVPQRFMLPMAGYNNSTPRQLPVGIDLRIEGTFELHPELFSVN